MEQISFEIAVGMWEFLEKLYSLLGCVHTSGS
jgi:hypothetical protein